MRIEAGSIAGCFEILPEISNDRRGRFVKTFHRDLFEKHGLRTDFAEEYYSVSNKGVIRGLHFQTPPHEHAKLVYCVTGRVFDAIVDLRVGSPTFGQFATFELSAEKGNLIYIPHGMAHGFYALTENVTMMYKVTSVYSPQHDGGIRWNSVGIPWPASSPVLSDRDMRFFDLSEFKSPFNFDQGG
jgi:dTDP-4-dehydrorhamnose 3,5-epimerase